MIAKGELRQTLRAAMRRLSEPEIAVASEQARTLLRGQAVWKEARTVLLYAPMAGELDLVPLLMEAIAEGKTVVLPGFVEERAEYDAFEIADLQRDCRPGKFGVAEPSQARGPFPLNRLDLALAPGLAFDLSGHRLGRGRGYFDRLLARAGGARCGIAFDWQIVAQVPVETHDVPMNFILTPTRWLAAATAHGPP